MVVYTSSVTAYGGASFPKGEALCPPLWGGWRKAPGEVNNNFPFRRRNQYDLSSWKM